MQGPSPAGVEVFVGVDVAKGDHCACAAKADGAEVLARSVPNDEAAINRLIDDAAAHGAVALMIDTTSSSAVLLIEAAACREVPVAYVSGLVMCRAADLYAGAAKTDPKDALVLADYARRNADRLTWTTPSDELLARLRILNGRDADLAADATRVANRLRDALLAVSPALERAVGDKVASNAGLQDALARWGTPTAFRSAGRARVRTRIAKRSPRSAQRLTDAIWAALDAQSLTVTAEAAWGDTISELAADLDRICGRRDQLTADIEEAFPAHPLEKVLSTMCGFGPRTGARTLAEIADPHRFAAGVRFETGLLGSLVFLALAVAWSLAFTGFPYTVALRTGNPAAVNSSFLIFFPFAFLTPAYLPRELMTGWMQTVAAWNPVTYLLEGMRSLLSDGWEAAALGKAAAAIGGLAAVTFVMAFRSLARRVATG